LLLSQLSLAQKVVLLRRLERISVAIEEKPLPTTAAKAAPALLLKALVYLLIMGYAPRGNWAGR
jgi:hypothetical protein